MEQKEKGLENKNWLLPLSIIIAALLVAGAVIYTDMDKNGGEPGGETGLNENQSDQKGNLVVNVDDPVLGNNEAKLTIVEFGDFQCPYCAKFSQEIEKNFRRDYVDSGKVRFVFKALAFLDRAPDSESKDAVNAAFCAKEQGKFWEFYDGIYDEEYAELKKTMAGQLESPEGNGNLNKSFFSGLASKNGLDMNAFVSCYDSKKYYDKANTYMTEARKLMPQGVGTPAIFSDRGKIELGLNANGEFDYEDFKRQIDALVK